MHASSRSKKLALLLLCLILSMCFVGCELKDNTIELDSSLLSTGPMLNPNIEGVIIQADTDSFLIEITHINMISEEAAHLVLFETVKEGDCFTVIPAMLDVSPKLTAKFAEEKITGDEYADYVNHIVMFHKDDVESFDDTTLYLKSLFIFHLQYSGDDE